MYAPTHVRRHKMYQNINKYTGSLEVIDIYNQTTSNNVSFVLNWIIVYIVNTIWYILYSKMNINLS